MQTFFIIAILVLGFLITFQIAKASEYVAIMRGEEKSKKQTKLERSRSILRCQQSRGNAAAINSPATTALRRTRTARKR